MTETVVVTGAARGIGRAVAERLAMDGYGVLALDREASLLESAYPNDGRIQTAMVDLDDEDHLGKLFGQIGDFRGIVNIAGTTRYGTFPQTDRAFVDRVFAENAGITFSACKAAVPHLLDRPGGARIVNMSSAAALATVTGFMAYSMAKAAIASFTKHLAVELATKRVTVNAVAPGPVETEMLAQNQSQEIRNSLLAGIPARRYGKPAEVAGTVSYLVGPDSDYVTGQIIPIDGGMMTTPIEMHLIS